MDIRQINSIYAHQLFKSNVLITLLMTNLASIPVESPFQDMHIIFNDCTFHFTYTWTIVTWNATWL